MTASCTCKIQLSHTRKKLVNGECSQRLTKATVMLVVAQEKERTVQMCVVILLLSCGEKKIPLTFWIENEFFFLFFFCFLTKLFSIKQTKELSSCCWPELSLL